MFENLKNIKLIQENKENIREVNRVDTEHQIITLYETQS